MGKGRGWHGESGRHRKAALGIKTASPRPAAMGKLTKELLTEMDGREISSLHYETVIGVRGSEVIDAGKVIDVLDTPKKVKRLWDELIYQEYGTTDMASIAAMEGF